MINFAFKQTRLQGLYLINLKPKTDYRGYFERVYCIEEFKELMPQKQINNINRSFTKQKGTIRGLHFQYPPFPKFPLLLMAMIYLALGRYNLTLIHFLYCMDLY